MISSREDYQRFLREDLQAHGVDRWGIVEYLKMPTLRFQRRLRWTEYVLNCRKGSVWAPYRAYLRWRLRQHGIKLGFTIGPNIFGPGLSIAHWGTLVVNPLCVVGSRCRIHPGTCLGEYKGQAPQLGDDCYIGPGAKLFGGIVLGNNTKVGPNAVVNASFPEGNVTLVGIPAKPTGRNSEPWRPAKHPPESRATESI